MPLASSADWQDRVNALWTIFDTLDANTFLEHMRKLVAERPQDDPVALFELASAHDSTDHEAEAAALYRRALALGLPDGLRRRVSIQLASTLRNLGQAEEGVSILRAEQTKPSDELEPSPPSSPFASPTWAATAKPSAWHWPRFPPTCRATIVR
jgi:hypothetical protein